MSHALLVKAWMTEYDAMKDTLEGMGDRAGSLEYNVVATEAMRLHECILDLVLDDYLEGNGHDG